MKIALYMTTVLEYGGGLEKYLIETAANLSRLPGVTVDVITMDNRVTDRLIDWQSIFYLKKIDKKLSYKEELSDIKRRLGAAHYYKEPTIKKLRARLQHYDVIYSKNEIIEGVVMRLLLHYHTLPPVVFGGHTPLRYPVARSPHAKLHNFLYGSLAYRWLAGGVSKFHALNNYEARLYAQLFPRRTVVKVYNPFDITAFRKGAKGADAHEEFDPQRLNILWVGRLTEQKGVADLARVVTAVNRQLGDGHTRVAWHICGDGDQRGIVTELARTQPNVQFHGHVDQKQMPAIYRQSHLFVSTSHWEGYPYTLIEPQAFGLQIFAYKIPGAEDILESYEGGHLAHDEPQLVAMLSDALRSYASQAAVPRSVPSDQFAPVTIYQQLLQLLQVEA